MQTLEMKKNGTASVLDSAALLKQWQGHRRVTRRTIEAFPEDKLFNYCIGGMRPFAELVREMLIMGAPGIRGVIDGTWPTYDEVSKTTKPSSKSELLSLWDKSSEELDNLWPQVSASRFQENDKFFGQYEGPIYWSIMYLIDNEIHHRAQGYVYLRSLGIEPPAFWDRS